MLFNYSKENNELYLRALEFASIAHAGAHRKGNNISYIVHPFEVAEIIATVTSDINVVCAGLLHDVVEDTPYTIDDIKKNFNEKIAILVDFESENKRPEIPASESWKIRKEESLNIIESAPHDAKTVVLGDKLSNLRALARDYIIIGDDVFNKFNQKDKNEHAWYYRTILWHLREFSNTSAWKELEELYRFVFEGE